MTAAVQTEPAQHADAAPSQGAAHGHPDGGGENLYLIGRPPLKNFLRFVKSHAVNPPGDGVLIDEWQAANTLVRRLEQDEAGAADDPPLGQPGPEYEPLLIEFLQDPLVRNGFNTVPTEVAFVRLDRLVVYQKHIDLTYARQLVETLRPALSQERISGPVSSTIILSRP